MSTIVTGYVEVPDALRADATDLANTAEAGGFSGGIR